MNKELEKKIYSMSNSFLPLDVFYNDIRDNPVENYNKEQAYKDIEIIADFIIDLQSQLDQQKAIWKKLKEWLDKEHKNQEPTDYEKMIYDEDYFIKSDFQIMIKRVKEKMQELEGEKE